MLTNGSVYTTDHSIVSGPKRGEIVASFDELCFLLGQPTRSDLDTDKQQCEFRARDRLGGCVAVWDWKSADPPAQTTRWSFWASDEYAGMLFRQALERLRLPEEILRG